MGKKRRILTRTTKFAKKYFEFLDKVDGASNVIDAAEVDDVIERGDTFIDTITAVDNEDETVTVTGRVLGGGHTTGDLQISVTGGAFGSDFASVQDAGAGGLDEITYSVTTGVLTKGTHTVRIRKKDETNEALYSDTVTIPVRENRISLVLEADCFKDDTEDNIDFDASKVTLAADPGKKKAGASGAGSDAVLGANSNISLRITILKDGVAQDIQDAANGNVAAFQTVGPGDFTAQALSITNILDNDVGGEVGDETTFVCRVEPVDSDGNVLSDSVVEQTVTVTKAAE